MLWRTPARTPRPLRVALLGNFGVGNIGNEASLDSVISLVKRADPQAEITVVCTTPEAVRARLGVPVRATRRRRPPASGSGSRRGALRETPGRVADLAGAVRVCLGVDALLVPGTGILDDFGKPKVTGWPLGLLVWMGTARLTRTGSALVCIGAGPLAHPVSRRFARWVGALADHRTFRDQGTREFMISTGLDVPADEVVPDIVFSRPSLPPARASSPRPLVAIPVMNYAGWRASAESTAHAERYVATLADFCGWLLGEGYAVRIITADGGDGPAAQRVTDRVRAADPQRAEAWLTTAVAESLADLTSLLSDATAVVATRYHGVISALLCGKPTLALAYGSNTSELMDTVGLGEYCQHVERVDPAWLRRQLTEVVADAPRVSRVVASGVEQLRARVQEEERKLQVSVLSRRRRIRVPLGMTSTPRTWTDG